MIPVAEKSPEGGVLYFAYGSNLNIADMRMRCPAAQPLRSLTIAGARLVFRRFADCVPEPGAACHGGLWRITPPCEAALDVYEELASGLYRKQVVVLTAPLDGELEVLMYVMNAVDIAPPSPGYLEVLRHGYRDFGLPVAALDEAARASREGQGALGSLPRRLESGGHAAGPPPENTSGTWRLQITATPDDRGGASAALMPMFDPRVGNASART